MPAASPSSPVPSTPYTVGLTGGIASGKTTVANIFAELGVSLVDADLVARLVVEPGRPELAVIAETFGENMLLTDGNLDRRQMREAVFADDIQRKKLEAILHPAIRHEIARQLAAINANYAVLVSPLLVEMGMHEQVDRVLVIDVPEATQRERLISRDEVSPELATQMLAAQVNRQTRLAAADDILDNSVPLTMLAQRIEELHRYYSAQARKEN